jgi:hypothetical protein
MRLDIARQKRLGRSGEAPSYVIAAKLQASGSERNEMAAHGLADYEMDLDEEDEDAEVIPVRDLLAGREFVFGNAREASDFEELLLAACSEFAQLLIDSEEFGGQDEYELPLEDLDDDEDEDEDEE